MKKGGLIYFKETRADIEWKRRVKEEGLLGHPPYAEWFCEDHYQEALKLKDRTKVEAIRILRIKFQ